jgi:carbon-monoxide dehydrogenase large subunit
VKWRADRQETFLCDVHGRDHATHGEMAFDKDGRILAMRIENIANVGAYLSDNGPRVCTAAGARVAGTVYDVPTLQLSVRVTFTNTVRSAPIAAPGGRRSPIRWSGCWIRARALWGSAATRSAGAISIRPRAIAVQEPRRAPDRFRAFPGDDGEGAAALGLGGLREAPRRRAPPRQIARHRLGVYCEASEGQPTEQAIVKVASNGPRRIDHGDRSATVRGMRPHSRRSSRRSFGVPFEMIDFRQGDTEFVKVGNGTGGRARHRWAASRRRAACDQIIEKAKRLAAHALEGAAAADITFRNGAFEVVGTDLRHEPHRRRGIRAEPGENCGGRNPRPRRDLSLPPPDRGQFPERRAYREVEIDAETGRVEVVKYTAVDDCGVLINPLLVIGQVQGGVLPGLGTGGARAHRLRSGLRPVPRRVIYGLRDAARRGHAADRGVVHPVPNPSNELGVKGIGEGGALRRRRRRSSAPFRTALGVGHIDMPLLPERIWHALRQNGQLRAAAQ